MSSVRCWSIKSFINLRFFSSASLIGSICCSCNCNIWWWKFAFFYFFGLLPSSLFSLSRSSINSREESKKLPTSLSSLCFCLSDGRGGASLMADFSGAFMVEFFTIGISSFLVDVLQPISAISETLTASLQPRTLWKFS